MKMNYKRAILALSVCGMIAFASPQKCYAEEIFAEETAASDTEASAEEMAPDNNTATVSDMPDNSSSDHTEEASVPVVTENNQDIQQAQAQLQEQEIQPAQEQSSEIITADTPAEESINNDQAVSTQDFSSDTPAAEEQTFDHQDTFEQNTDQTIRETVTGQTIPEMDADQAIPDTVEDSAIPETGAGQAIPTTAETDSVQPELITPAEENAEETIDVILDPETSPEDEPAVSELPANQFAESNLHETMETKKPLTFSVYAAAPSMTVLAVEPAGGSVAASAIEDNLAAETAVSAEIAAEESITGSTLAEEQPAAVMKVAAPVAAAPQMAAVQTKAAAPVNSAYSVTAGSGEYSHIITVTASATNNAVKDTDNIQQALKYAKELLTGAGGKKALVKIQTGTYLIDSLKIYSNTDLQLAGNTTLRRNLSRNSGVMLSGGDVNPNSISVSGGIWDGNVTRATAGTSSQPLISFNNGSRITLKNMTLRNTSAPRAITLANCSSSKIENVKIENRSDAPGGGILASGSGIQVVNNSIDNTRNEAICLSATTNAVVSNNQIENSGVEGKSYAIGVNSSQGATIKENTIDNSYAGIVLKSTTGSTVSGNTTRWQKTGYSIALRKGSNGNTVTGNTMSKTNKVIQDSTSRNNTISDNLKFVGAFEKTGTVQRFKLDDGSYAKNRWINANGKFYHFDEYGQMQTGWYKENGNVYYLDPQKGYRVKYVQKIGNKEYYFAKNGIMHTGWLKYKATKGWKYYGEDGSLQTGWVTAGGKTYYLDPRNEGYRVRYVQKIGNKEYYFDKNGAMHTGWLKYKATKGWKYYGEDGSLQTGWVTTGGKTYYLDPKNEGYRVRYVQNIGNREYYFDKYGVMHTGWLRYRETKGWKYYGEDGAMQIGWLSLGDKKYYLNPKDGYRVTGTVKIDGKQYVFNSDGSLVTNEKKYRSTGNSFLDKIRDMVIKDMKSSGILASLTAAQAFLESAQGQSRLTQIANNLFGIKGYYHGNSVVMQTTEYIGGRYVTENDVFRAYSSWEESVADHSDLFNSLSRYSNLRNLTDYRRAATYVRQDGYATDPKYTLSLLNIIKQYGLNEWDNSTSYYLPGERDVVVTASALNVRSMPSTGGSILTSLPNGMIVTIDRTEGGWGRLADYQSGWVSLDYVRNR